MLSDTTYSRGLVAKGVMARMYSRKSNQAGTEVEGKKKLVLSLMLRKAEGKVQKM